MQHPSLNEAARTLRDGGCVVYPTETYFALGARATNANALARIVAIKARPATKPLPLLVGDLSHLEAVLPEGFAAGPLGADFTALVERFWPGPLSLVVPCRETLPDLVKDRQGRVSVRFTPHPTAAALCRLVGGAGQAPSAHRSGRPNADVSRCRAHRRGARGHERQPQRTPAGSPAPGTGPGSGGRGRCPGHRRPGTKRRSGLDRGRTPGRPAPGSLSRRGRGGRGLGGGRLHPRAVKRVRFPREARGPAAP